MAGPDPGVQPSLSLIVAKSLIGAHGNNKPGIADETYLRSPVPNGRPGGEFSFAPGTQKPAGQQIMDLPDGCPAHRYRIVI